MISMAEEKNGFKMGKEDKLKQRIRWALFSISLIVFLFVIGMYNIWPLAIVVGVIFIFVGEAIIRLFERRQ